MKNKKRSRDKRIHFKPYLRNGQLEYYGLKLETNSSLVTNIKVKLVQKTILPVLFYKKVLLVISSFLEHLNKADFVMVTKSVVTSRLLAL